MWSARQHAAPADSYDLEVTPSVDRARASSAPVRRSAAFASVLHVNEKGGRFGGTEEYIDLLTSGLGRRGVTSHLACGTLGSAPPIGLASVDVVAGLASRTPVAGTAEQLVELVDRLRPDVVYLHNVFDPGVVEALAGMTRRGPLLWYVHDHYVTCLSELRWRHDIGPCDVRLGSACLASIDGGRCVLRRQDERFDGGVLDTRTRLAGTLAMADAVIVVSDYMRDLLTAADTSIGPRLHHVRRPVRGRSGAVRPARGPDDRVVVTYAGRIAPEKGLAVVLEAIGATAAVRPVDVRIAGVVEHHDYWAACQAMAVAARRNGTTVSWLGHLDYRQVDELFAESDIVVVPSLWPEPLGAVAAEAMTAGAAVVVSDVGGLRELVTDGHDGIVAPPGEPAGWRDALDDLVADDRRRAVIGHRARRAMDGRTVDQHITELEHIVATLGH